MTKLSLMSVVVSLLPMVAMAGSDNSVTTVNRADADQCIQTDNDIGRLACFDALFAKPAVAAPLPEASAPAPAAVAQKSTIEEAFPLHGAKTESSGETPVLYSAVAAMKKGPYKRYYLELENDHVWREKEKSRHRYKVGTKIRIEKGALGANYLYVEGKSGIVLVERVK